MFREVGDPVLVGGRTSELPLDVVSSDGVRLVAPPLRPTRSTRDPSSMHEHRHGTAADSNTVPEPKFGMHPP
jgi:hypothetical protein